MNQPQDASSNDRLFCWEQISRTNPAFRVSQVFATREDASRLLPLYALFAIVEQICSGSSDVELAHRKLDWWRIECSPNNLRASRHPVLREFQRTGAVDHLAQDLVHSLLDSAESRLEGQALIDISALKAFCIATQRPQFDLEMAISNPGENAHEPDRGVLARTGLLQLIRESACRSEQGAYWWVPLNLLARHGINRSALVESSGSAEANTLLSELIRESDSWVSSSTASPAQGNARALRNYFAITGINTRIINGLKGVSPNDYAKELRRIRISDLVVAWRCARRGRY